MNLTLPSYRVYTGPLFPYSVNHSNEGPVVKRVGVIKKIPLVHHPDLEKMQLNWVSHNQQFQPHKSNTDCSYSSTDLFSL